MSERTYTVLVYCHRLGIETKKTKVSPVSITANVASWGKLESFWSRYLLCIIYLSSFLTFKWNAMAWNFLDSLKRRHTTQLCKISSKYVQKHLTSLENQSPFISDTYRYIAIKMKINKNKTNGKIHTKKTWILSVSLHVLGPFLQ